MEIALPMDVIGAQIRLILLWDIAQLMEIVLMEIALFVVMSEI